MDVSQKKAGDLTEGFKNVGGRKAEVCSKYDDLFHLDNDDGFAKNMQLLNEGPKVGM